MIGAHMPTSYPEIRNLALEALVGNNRNTTLAHARSALKQALAAEGKSVEAYNVFANNFVQQLKCAAGVSRIISVRGLSYLANEQALVSAALLMLSSGRGDSGYAKIVAAELLDALDVTFASRQSRMAALRLLSDAFGPLTFADNLPLRIRDDIDVHADGASQSIADDEEQQQLGGRLHSPRRRGQGRYSRERTSELIATLLVHARLASQMEEATIDAVVRSIGVTIPRTDDVLKRAALDAAYMFFGDVKIRTPARKNIRLEEYAAASGAPNNQMLAAQFAFMFMDARSKVMRGNTRALTKAFRRLFKRTAERLSRIVNYSNVARSVVVFLAKVLAMATGEPAQAYISNYDNSVSAGVYAQLGAQLEAAGSADTTLEEQQIGCPCDELALPAPIAQPIGDEEQQAQIDASLFSRAKEAVTGRASGKRYRVTVMADELVARIADWFLAVFNYDKRISAENVLALTEFSFYSQSVSNQFNSQAEGITSDKTRIKDVVSIMANGFARGPLPVPPSRREMITLTQFVQKRRRQLTPAEMAKEFTNVLLYFTRGQRVTTVVGAPQAELDKRTKEIQSDMQSLYRKVVREVQRISEVDAAPEIVARVLLAIFSAMSDIDYAFTYQPPTRRSMSPQRRLSSPTRWFSSTEAASQ
jgi:hypothetical protein